jgi:hypothetical protein
VSQPRGSPTGKDGIALNDMAARRNDDGLVRISGDVIFHRVTSVQLSLDIDDV